MKLPTPIGLSLEKGVIGHILRQLPRRVLDEADQHDSPWAWLARWVENNPVEHWRIGTVNMRDAECAVLENEGFKRTDIGVYSADANTRRRTTIYKGIHEVRFYSHKYDSTRVFMRVVMSGRWPDSFRKTFEAAASQRKAFLRLAAAARGGGSLCSTWYLKMRTAQIKGDERMTDHRANKETASILQTQRGRQWLLEGKAPGAPPEGGTPNSQPLILTRNSADLPCALRPSSSANFRTAGRAFFKAARSYSTMLVRRWN